MARIRQVEIKNFRGIKSLSWFPSEGLNCLIGAGDSGKSSVLEAIYFCLGGRRNIQFTDVDFYQLNVEEDIEIGLTVGDLDDRLKNFEAYGDYLRGFNLDNRTIEDEPESHMETVLTLTLSVGSDLVPSWSLTSERAATQGKSRDLVWGDRFRAAPTRIDAKSAYHLGWRQGSVLNRVSSERADASSELAQYARLARAGLDEVTPDQLEKTLSIVASKARELGIPIGDRVKAMLDAQSVSFSGGTISLHNANGIPLAGLGSGSIRLLVAGLQREATEHSKIILIDEVEHGLEPHRIIRLLGSLGAKYEDKPLQVFAATHSPVVVRELSGDQLFIIRPREHDHEILPVGMSDEVQGTVRLYPEAFLAVSVIVCEGASEVGLLRGIDQYRASMGHESINAMGTGLVDGSGRDELLKRAAAFQRLGYRVAVLRDSDVEPVEPEESCLVDGGGKVVAWRSGNAIEDELFLSLTNEGVKKLTRRAIEVHGEKLIDDHIKSHTNGERNLESILSEAAGNDPVTVENGQILGKAAGKSGWFKTVSQMEYVGREIVGPDLARAKPEFRTRIDDLFGWAGNTVEHDQPSFN